MFEPRNNSASLTKSLLCNYYLDEADLRLFYNTDFFFRDIIIFISINIILFNQVLTVNNHKTWTFTFQGVHASFAQT